jgi:hypothetical protein
MQDHDKWHWSQWGENDAPSLLPIGKILSEYLALFFFNTSTAIFFAELRVIKD